MIRNIEAKTAFSTSSEPEFWFGCKYTINPYRGCEHKCIYCDSRSQCYGVEEFDDVVEAKVNLPELLRGELSKKKTKAIMGFGAMSDPWTPAEHRLEITKKCLEVLREFSWPVHLTTKSDMCIRDEALLKDIMERSYANVALTLTTVDDSLAKKIEPNAPLPSKRLRAMERLAKAGIKVGTIMTPILPFIEDNISNIENIITATYNAGGTFNIGFLGMTLRDRQRAYYYRELDKLFPGTRIRYEEAFKEDYSASAQNYDELYAFSKNKCKELGLCFDMKDFDYYNKNKAGVQTSFI